MKRTIKEVKTYTVKMTVYTDGHSTMNRTNKNFSIMELIGILEVVKTDLMTIIKEGMQKVLPKAIKRKSTNSKMI